MNNLLTLFISFFQVGLFSVGGGYAAIPLIQEQIVRVQGLISLSDFNDLIIIAETTPGPISINSATFVGNKVAGIPGALICTLGCVIPSFIICLILAKVYYKYKGLSGLELVLASLRPAVVALIGSAAMSILTSALFDNENAILDDLNIFVSSLFNGESIVLSNFKVITDFRILEFILFIVAFVSLKKFKLNPIAVIFGTGIIGTIIHFIIF